MTIDQFVINLANVVLNPLLKLLFAAALLYFIWGVFQYLLNADSDSGRSTGRQHILWGIIGMAIMAGAFGILEIASRTLLGG